MDDAGNVAAAVEAGLRLTFAAVKSAYMVAEIDGSTLGWEFGGAHCSLPGLWGSEGENAKVTSLWSGQACLIR